MCLRAIVVATCGAILLSPPAAGQSSSYSSDWRPPEAKAAPAKPERPGLHRLLRELDRMISKAERDRAADPRVLSDMRALARRYARNWPQLVLKESFLDGNLTADPRWIVESGEFRVGRRGLVMGRGRAGQTPGYATSPSPPEPREEPEPRFGEAVIGALLEGLTRDGDSGASAPERTIDSEPASPEPAPTFVTGGEGRLRTRVVIPNAFALRVALRSRRNTGGTFEMGVGQGARDSGYRLIYRPAGTPSLSVVRVGARGTKTIGSVYEQIRLEDRKLHKLELARDLLGEVTLAVDGKTLFRRRDRAFQDDFDSVLLGSTGGVYVVRGVVVVGAP